MNHCVPWRAVARPATAVLMGLICLTAGQAVAEEPKNSLSAKSSQGVSAGVAATPVAVELDPLTLEDALELARTRAPTASVAESRAKEAEAELVDASRSLRDNPTLGVGAGPRIGGEDEVAPVVELRYMQPFELGGQRGSRVDAAEASQKQADARAASTVLELQIEVGRVYLDAVAAHDRYILADNVNTLTGELVAAAELRYEAGDLSELDVAVARLALKQAEATAEMKRARYQQALVELRAVLVLPGDASLSVEGTLKDYTDAPSLSALSDRAAERPELRALQAEQEKSEALLDLADAERWPDLAAGVGYELEEGAHAVVGTVQFTLPFFDRADATESLAASRKAAAAVEYQATRSTVTTRLESLHAVWQDARDIASTYEKDALELASSSEEMLQTAYDSGAIPLNELLSLRRELVSARETHIELLQEAAFVAFELRASAGDLP